MISRILSDSVTTMGYDPVKGKWVKRRDCCNVQNVRFAGRDFHLLYKDRYYFVAVESGKDMYTVWYVKEEGLLPGEALSIFRKGFTKKGITPEMVDSFLENPPLYAEKYGTPAK